jgi:pimeloyl-ACP methyl ester carboxylesterase
MASPEADVASLPHETPIIYGRNDQAILLSTLLLKFLHLIPGSQLHDFGRCGHATQIEHSARSPAWSVISSPKRSPISPRRWTDPCTLQSPMPV